MYKIAKRLTIAILALVVVVGTVQTAHAQWNLLRPDTITKWLDNLPRPIPIGGRTVFPTYDYYEIGVAPTQQFLHANFPQMTNLWGYGYKDGNGVFHPTYPGMTIEATRNRPTHVLWSNQLVDNFGSPLQHLFTVDQTLHWADPLMQRDMSVFPPIYNVRTPYTGPVPMVPHLHGGEVQSYYDGNPDAWFTPNWGITGMMYTPGRDEYIYPNGQAGTTLWYHDHAMGITRLNVYAGMAGFYLLRDPNDPCEPRLPQGTYEIPIVIQDRFIDANYQFAYAVPAAIPALHPFWGPENFGNIIVVNGKVWPKLDVEPRKYRLRMLNGSQARFYNLTFDNPNVRVYQIGTDGGFLRTPVRLTQLMIAPGERADLIVDFSALPVGTSTILTNNANAPFPGGNPPDPLTTGQILRVNVNIPLQGRDRSAVPTFIRSIPSLLAQPLAGVRNITLDETLDINGNTQIMVVNGRAYEDVMQEMPRLGETEIWRMINLTADTHPMHLHLVSFQLISRQAFNLNAYMTAYMAANPLGIPVPYNTPHVIPDPTPYYIGAPTFADPNEQGWKDTYRCNHAEVTTFAVKFAPADGGAFPFDATAGPGYVYHCHILDHEDNDMMRPYRVLPPTPKATEEITTTPQRNGDFTLDQNYPNPAVSSTAIKYFVPEESHVTLKVYDLVGNEIATLVDAVQKGEQNFMFDTQDLSNGVYMYKIQAGSHYDSKTFVVMR